MYSIVVKQYKNNNGSITSIIGIRLDGPYEDMRNVKVYLTVNDAKQVFKNKIRKMKGGA